MQWQYNNWLHVCACINLMFCGIIDVGMCCTIIKYVILQKVNLVMNDDNLHIVSQPLTGMQMGEYFGFSLLAVDLNGDK